jgi:hypothetical protein
MAVPPDAGHRLIGSTSASGTRGQMSWPAPEEPTRRQQLLRGGILRVVRDYLLSASARRSLSSSTLPVPGRLRLANRSLSSCLGQAFVAPARQPIRAQHGRAHPQRG